MADKALAVGIDLGTTNSCVAYLNGGEPQVLRILMVITPPPR